MMADWTEIPYDILDKISRRIIKEILIITMVAYSIISNPSSTIDPY